MGGVGGCLLFVMYRLQVGGGGGGGLDGGT